MKKVEDVITQRIETAARAIAAAFKGPPDESNPRDLITDLLHLMDSAGKDLSVELVSAFNHFLAEKVGDHPNKRAVLAALQGILNERGSRIYGQQ